MGRAFPAPAPAPDRDAYLMNALGKQTRQPLSWARQEGLLAGQRNKKLETLWQDFRNWTAHPHRHVDMPTNAARTVHDVAEVINHLWGHSTPGGRLYPAPLGRVAVVLGWSNGPRSHSRVAMAPTAFAGFPHVTDDWSFAVVLAVPHGGFLTDFDSRYELTEFPSDLLWGQGTGPKLLAWLITHVPSGDTVTYQDRVFAIQQTDTKTYLPHRPPVALGLPPERRAGTWHLVLADDPRTAFYHVRHRGGACPRAEAVMH